MTTTHTPHMTRAQYAEARSWLLANGPTDLPYFVDLANHIELVRALDRHYDGGAMQFASDTAGMV